jgi:hypothetical protein
MKLNRLIAVSIVGFSLLTTSSSAFACDHEGGGSPSYFGWCHRDHDCDHDKDKGGHDCPGHGGGSGSTTQPTPPSSTGPKG